MSCVLGVVGPRPRQLVLVEDPELHRALRSPVAWKPSRISPATRVGPRARARPPRSRCLHEVLAVGAERLLERRVPERADHLGARDLPAGLADERAVAHLGERGAQVVDVRRLVGTDVADERGRLAVAGDEVGVGEHRFGPRERVERRDLDEQQPDHAPDHHLEREVEVGEPAQRFRVAPRLFGRRRLAAGLGDAHALEHRLRHVLGDRLLERDVARREPHLLVAAFVFPTRFVARVRLEQAALQVRDRGAGDRLVEVRLQVVDVHGADHRAEALDGADAGERRDRRLRARPRAAGTSTARRSGTPRATARSARRGSRCRTARGATAATRRSRARGARAGRHVAPVGVEAAVAAHAARDERLLDVVAGQQLALGERELQTRHESECRSAARTASDRGRDRGNAVARRGSRPRPAAPR